MKGVRCFVGIVSKYMRMYVVHTAHYHMVVDNKAHMGYEAHHRTRGDGALGASFFFGHEDMQNSGDITVHYERVTCVCGI